MRENVVRIYYPEEYTTEKAQKESGRPTPPGNRSTAPRHCKKTQKRRPILYRIVRFCKRVNWGRVAILGLCVLGVIYLITGVIGLFTAPDDTTAEQPTPTPEITVEQPVTQIEYIFRDGEGTPVDMQATTSAWAAEAGLEKRYDLTDAERWEVASVVTAEAGGEPFAGMVAVAQCILQTCEDTGLRPAAALVRYGYAQTRPEPTEDALDAVQAVFDFGQVATTEPIKYFYAPDLVFSSWHESQEYVLTINGHKFFKEAE